MAKITINDLLEAGCHFGHQTRRWNPKMKHFVYGSRNGISIIDLTITMRQIADACNFLQRVVGNGGDILFVGTKRQAQQITRELAERTGMYYVSERWMGGTLTNNVTIRKSIQKMYDLDKVLASDEVKSLKKKELSIMSRDCARLHRDLDGIADMKKLPAAMIIIDVCNDNIAVSEANKLNIPIIGICDTNANPDLIDYPVAANDDAVKSIKVITDLFCDAILVAKEVYQKRVVEERAAKEAAAKKAADEKAAAEAAKAEEAAAAPQEEVKIDSVAGVKVEKKAAKKPAAKKTAAKKPAAKKEEAEKETEAKAE
ncbi:MAG: 30S ribosomal protein S2 [Victivallaceae bacterium]